MIPVWAILIVVLFFMIMIGLVVGTVVSAHKDVEFAILVEKAYRRSAKEKREKEEREQEMKYEHNKVLRDMQKELVDKLYDILTTHNPTFEQLSIAGEYINLWHRLENKKIK